VPQTAARRAPPVLSNDAILASGGFPRESGPEQKDAGARDLLHRHGEKGREQHSLDVVFPVLDHVSPQNLDGAHVAIVLPLQEVNLFQEFLLVPSELAQPTHGGRLANKV
jgi:hypothetical protein